MIIPLLLLLPRLAKKVAVVRYPASKPDRVIVRMRVQSQVSSTGIALVLGKMLAKRRRGRRMTLTRVRRRSSQQLGRRENTAAKTPVAKARWKLAKPSREVKWRLACQEGARGAMLCNTEGRMRWVSRQERKRWRWERENGMGTLELWEGGLQR